MIFEQLDKLSKINAVSSDETSVVEYIKNEINGLCEYYEDNLGNLICYKKGKQKPDKKIMVTATMDEVGFIVNGITNDGLLKFTAIGNVDERVVLGRSVNIYSKNIIGVIGTKAIHQQTEEERNKTVDIADMFIDIGVDSKEKASQLVSLGDLICFCTNPFKMGKSNFKGKAMDSRSSILIAIDLIKKELEYDCYIVFGAQSKLGQRGLQVATQSIKPDIAVVLDTTISADISFVSKDNKICTLGKGVVLGLMDKNTISSKRLYELVKDISSKNDIPVQYKTKTMGSISLADINKLAGGVETIFLGIPCRNPNSAVSIVNIEDMNSVSDLLYLLINNESLIKK